MPPFFSVILPTYNRARMVRTALKTVLSQTFREWECLVVDDGSTDGTVPALEDLARDPRVRVLRSEVNRGMNASRNRAIEGSRGQFVTVLDSDDLWLPQRLERFRDRIDRSPRAGFVFSNAFVWRYGRILGPLFPPDRAIPEGEVPGYYAVGDRYLPYVTTNLAIRRSGFADWGGFKTEMKTLDTELFARFLARGLEVAVIPSPLSVRRLHGEQLTDRYVENFKESLVALGSSGADEQTQRRLRAEICRDIALYLAKAGRPSEARAFLRAELGGAARSCGAYPWTLVPAPLLRLARSVRREWLRLRYSPAWASAEIRGLYRWLDPLLAEESRAA